MSIDQKVYDALKVLSDYCSGRYCNKCAFKTEDKGVGMCRVKYHNPQDLFHKITINTVTEYKFEDDKNE